MALFKILKGPEAALPTVAHEGWAYVTDEGNFYVDMTDDIKDRVKINKNAEYAIKADKDSKNQIIADNYIVDVQLTNHGTAPYYKLKLGNGNIKDSDKDGKADQVLLPVANASNGGIITTGTQTIAGDKTFTHTVTLSKASALNYTGIEDGNAAGARVVWFAHSSKPGTPVKNDKFTYNPSSTTPWAGYDDGATAAAHGVLNLDRVNGISLQALQDSTGLTIKDTYIKNVVLHNDGVSPYYTLTLGSGVDKDTDSKVSGPDKVGIPIAGETTAGIITNAAQTIYGAKTFNALLTTSEGIASPKDISTEAQFKSTLADGTAPFVVSSKTLVANLNADTVDGMHASNSPFGAADALNDTVPTQMAIWSSLNSLLVSASALIYKGLIDPNNSNTIPTNPIKGSVYIISAEGTFNDVFCEPGDMAIYYDANKWDIIQTNIDGAIRIKSGGSLTNVHSTDHAIPRFDGTSGRVLQNSKVGIDDSGNVIPDAAGSATAGQTLGSSAKPWKTVYGLSFSGLANQATHDDGNNVIKTHYIADIIYNESTSAPTYSLKQGDGTVRTDKLTIPVASTTAAGVITADTTNTQTLTGPKVLDSSGSLAIQKQDGFKYSGIKAYTDTNTAMYLWFSTVGSNGGTPKYNANLLFNPKATDATSGNWSDYKTSGNYAVITTDRFNGLALNALKDDTGQTIKNTYIKNVVLVDNATAPYYTLTLGNGSAKDTDTTVSGPDKVLLPVAGTSYAGVVTTSTQTFAGAKTFQDGVTFSHKTFIYSGIEKATADADRSVWFSDSAQVGKPCYSDNFKYNPNASVQWEPYDENIIKTGLLTVPRIEGLARKALEDSQGWIIDDTYIRDVKLYNHTTSPYYTLVLGNGLEKTTDKKVDQVKLPVADSSDKTSSKWTAGIITTGAQVLSGAKTLNTSGSLTIQGTNAFAYTGIQEQTIAANSDLCLWFSEVGDNTNNGIPKYAAGLTYNPAASVNWDVIDTQTVSANVLTVARLEGLAHKALADDAGNVIKENYIRAISFVIDKVSDTVAPDAKTNPYLKYTMGNNTAHTYLQIPAAQSSRGGIVTASAQTFTGIKTMESGLIVSAKSNFQFTGIEEASTAVARPIWFSYATGSGANAAANPAIPVYNNAFTYNPNGSSKWGKDTANVTSGILKVDRVDGLAYKAVNDESNQCINTTYIKGLSLANNKFTITKGSDVTSTFDLVIPVNPTDTSKYVAGQMWIVTS